MIADGRRPECRLALVLLIVLFLGCSEFDSQHGAPLEKLPDIDLGGMESPVVSQLTALRHQAETASTTSTSDEDVVMAWGQLGEAYHAYGLSEGARTAYRNAAALSADPTRWWYLLAQVEIAAGELDQAATLLRRARNSASTNLFVLRSLAETERQRGELEESRRLARQLVEIHPEDASTWLVLAETEVELGQMEAALEAYERCLDLQPSATKLRAPIATLLRQLNRNDEASAQLEQAGETPLFRTDPWLESVASRRIGYAAAMKRGRDQFQQGNFAAASRAFEEAATERPESPEANLNLGASLLRSGDVTHAVDVLARLVAMDTENPSAWLNYGSALMVAGNRNEAIEAFKRAIEHRPDYWLAHRQLAELYCAMHRWDEAINHFKESLQISPGDERALAVASVCLVEAGRYREALGWAQQGLETLPSSLALAGITARILAASPDPAVRDGSRARIIADDLVTRVPHPYHREVLAMALAETTEFEQALIEAQEALVEVASRDAALTAVLKEQIESYRQSRPWRDPGDRLVFSD